MQKRLLILLLLPWIIPLCCFDATAETRKIAILQTTDIHSRFRSEKGPGWLRLATLIKRELEKSGGKEKCLLIDCGDSVQGSTTATLAQGSPGVILLNLLKYDAWILGNHEFDFGPKVLKSLIKQAKIPVFAANLEWLDTSKPDFIGWKMYERNGLKIAVIGITSPKLPQWLWGKALKGYRVRSIAWALDRFLPKALAENPDLVILAVHHGIYISPRAEDNYLTSIAWKYPELDLILGGHSHQKEPGKQLGMNTWYANAGKHAEYLWKGNVAIDTKTRKVTINSRLIPVTKKIPEDQECAAAIKDSLQTAKAFAKRKVGSTVRPVTPLKRGKYNASINELFCRAIAAAGNTEIAFHGTVRWREALRGKITEHDVYRIEPYEDTVCTIDITPAEAKEILAEQISKRDYDRFQSPWGFYATADKNGIVTGKLKLKNGKIWDNGRIRCAFSSYTLAGSSNKFPKLRAIARKPESNPCDTGITVRDALRKYIYNNSPLDIKTIQWLKIEK